MSESAILIAETECCRAAKRIRIRLKVRGGAWVGQAHDDGTYEMVRAGEERAQRILRSGSPCVAGTFNADVGMTDLRDALAYARLGEVAYKRRPKTAAERAWHAKYQRVRRAQRRAAGLAA